MEWTQIFALIFGNLALILPLWLWNRGEARSDARHMEVKLELNRELIRAIHDEVKDFHYRLVEVERNRK